MHGKLKITEFIKLSKNLFAIAHKLFPCMMAPVVGVFIIIAQDTQGRMEVHLSAT